MNSGQDFYPQTELMRGLLQTEINKLLADHRISTFTDHLRESPTETEQTADTACTPGTARVNIGPQGTRTFFAVGARPYTISPMSMVPKADGGWRLIVNLQALNEFITDQPFSNEKWASVERRILPGVWMMSIDLESGFNHVVMRWNFRNFLGISLDGIDYVWNVLPFGLKVAPWIFAKMLKPAMRRARAKGLTVFIYVDDMLLLAVSPDGRALTETEATAQGIILREALEHYGWVINLKKSVLVPTHTITHLGFIVDTSPELPEALFRIPPHKKTALRKSIKQMMRKTTVAPKILASMIGSLQFLVRAIWMGPIFLRSLIRTLNTKESWARTDTVTLTDLNRQDLAWWLEAIKNFEGSPPITTDPTWIMTTDASGTGWGATLHRYPLTLDEDILYRAQGMWAVEVAEESSNAREMETINMGLQAFRQQIRKSRIQVRSDNTTTVCYLNKLGGRVVDLYERSLRTVEFCMQEGIRITAIHLAGVLNDEADRLSRMVDKDDWKLNPRLFEELQSRWGPHSVDRFASMANRQLDRFNSAWSDPMAETVDAFSVSWTQENNYANPPFEMMDRVLEKIHRDRCNITLIAPTWQQHHWYWRLQEMAQERIILPNSKDTFLQARLGSIYPASATNWESCAYRITY
jgi:hypothetical protein